MNNLANKSNISLNIYNFIFMLPFWCTSGFCSCFVMNFFTTTINIFEEDFCTIRKKILSPPETIEKLAVETEPCVVDFSWSHTQSNVVRRIYVMQARYISYLYRVSMIYWISYILSERLVRSSFQWKSSQMWEIIATSARGCCKKRQPQLIRDAGIIQQVCSSIRK